MSGRLRTALSRFMATSADLVAEHESEQSTLHGGTRVTDLAARRPDSVCGVLRTVTLRPRAGVPALEAELFDGSGSLRVIWLGRRQIAGVEVGRRLMVHGMITQVGGSLAMYNPKYELVARG